MGSRGSHVKLKRLTAAGERKIVVPMHREVAFGTLDSIVKQAGISMDELRAKLK